MDKSPLISVIVPVYNVEKYIKRTVDSILNQSYEKIEIILVDDGSTDFSGNIIDEIAVANPYRVKSYHKSNAGVSKARIFGVLQAKGDWIGFVDGDDTIESDMYEMLLCNAIEYKADISHCGYTMVFEDGRNHLFYNSKLLFEHNTIEALTELLTGRMFEPGLCNKLFKRELFNKLISCDSMDYSIKNNEDLLMNFILFSYSKKSVFFDVCKYNYIVRKGSASRRSLNDNVINDPIRVKEHIIRLAPKEIKDIAETAYIGTCVNAYNGVVMSNDRCYSNELKSIRARIKEKKLYIKKMGRKTKFLARLILVAPWVYRPLYSVYANHFQNKKYG